MWEHMSGSQTPSDTTQGGGIRGHLGGEATPGQESRVEAVPGRGPASSGQRAAPWGLGVTQR